jgi:hypothetical protein
MCSSTKEPIFLLPPATSSSWCGARLIDAPCFFIYTAWCRRSHFLYTRNNVGSRVTCHADMCTYACKKNKKNTCSFGSGSCRCTLTLFGLTGIPSEEALMTRSCLAAVFSGTLNNVPSLSSSKQQQQQTWNRHQPNPRPQLWFEPICGRYGSG